MIVWLLLTYLILTIRLRVVDTLFGTAPARSKLLLLGSGVIVALLLFSIPKVASLIGIQGVSLFDSQTLLSIVWWYLILAGAEEIGKFGAGWISYIREHLSSNDLILYSITIALGFAFAENLIYLIIQTQSAAEATSLALSRWLTWFLWHAIFTGSIWYIASQYSGSNTWKNISRYILALIAGIGLHLIYNLFLHYGIVGWFLLYIILWYALLSFLFYKSDRVYLD